MATIGEAIKEAVARDDANECGRIAEQLRLHHGMTYAEIADLACRVANISPWDWEALMRESEWVAWSAVTIAADWRDLARSTGSTDWIEQRVTNERLGIPGVS